MKSKKRVYIIIAIITLAILLFAFFRSNSTRKSTIQIKAGDIDFSDTVVATILDLLVVKVRKVKQKQLSLQIKLLIYY